MTIKTEKPATKRHADEMDEMPYYAALGKSLGMSERAIKKMCALMLCDAMQRRKTPTRKTKGRP